MTAPRTEAGRALLKGFVWSRLRQSILRIEAEAKLDEGLQETQDRLLALLMRMGWRSAYDRVRVALIDVPDDGPRHTDTEGAAMTDTPRTAAAQDLVREWQDFFPELVRRGDLRPKDLAAIEAEALPTAEALSRAGDAVASRFGWVPVDVTEWGITDDHYWAAILAALKEQP